MFECAGRWMEGHVDIANNYWKSCTSKQEENPCKFQPHKAWWNSTSQIQESWCVSTDPCLFPDDHFIWERKVAFPFIKIDHRLAPSLPVFHNCKRWITCLNLPFSTRFIHSKGSLASTFFTKRRPHPTPRYRVFKTLPVAFSNMTFHSGSHIITFCSQD